MKRKVGDLLLTTLSDSSSMPATNFTAVSSSRTSGGYASDFVRAKHVRDGGKPPGRAYHLLLFGDAQAMVLRPEELRGTSIIGFAALLYCAD
jgi:hypothetical protein